MPKHPVVSAILGLLLLAVAGQARASGDYGCTPEARLKRRDYSACSNLALLTPGNDTRVNLLLLLADRGQARLAIPRTENRDTDNPVPAALLSWRADLAAPATGTPSPNTPEADSADGRCVSNRSGQAGFLRALADDTSLSKDERSQLTEARAKVAATCGHPEEASVLLTALAGQMRSASGKAFAAYVMAASVFYGPAPNESRSAFTTLAEVKQPWVREAAQYMLARADLNTAQLDAFHGYGNLDLAKVDQAALQRAREGFLRYLKLYPKGAYAGSAEGLMRRVEWFGGDATRTTLAYSRALLQPGIQTTDLVQEVDNRLLFTNKTGAQTPLATTDPILLAVDDLWRMRQVDMDASKLALNATELAAQQPVFAKTPELWRYLQATHAYYVQRKPADVLQLLPASTPRGVPGYLQFSSQMLRLIAMDDLGQPGVREGILALLPVATAPYQRASLELLLAGHDERHQQVARVFAADSAVRDPAIRRILLQNIAGPELLMQQAASRTAAAQERETALFTLLYRSLTRGQFALFNTWSQRIPTGATKSKDSYDLLYPAPQLAVFRWPGDDTGYRCPALSAITNTLARAPRDVASNLCLAEFFRLNGFDHFALSEPSEDYRRDARKQAQISGELGSSGLLFPGKEINRQSIYRGVIADAAASRDDRAYALLRAIRCYAPSGNNDCGGAEAPMSERKRWFTTLKTQYKDSRWAAAVEHYW